MFSVLYITYFNVCVLHIYQCLSIFFNLRNIKYNDTLITLSNNSLAHILTKVCFQVFKFYNNAKFYRFVI